MGVDSCMSAITTKISDEWADAKYTLSQRKTWEIVTALILIVLLIASTVMAFIFTIVAPPGELGAQASGAGSAAVSSRHRVPLVYRRSVEDLLIENPDSVQKQASSSGIDDALSCVQIGSDLVEEGVSHSEAAKEIILCLGKVSIPEMENVLKLEEELASALFTGNQDAAMEILIKMIQYDVIGGQKSA